MAEFHTPVGLTHNRGLIADPEAFARDANAESWLFLCGEDFAAIEGGMSYASVQASVGESINIVSDPPTVLDMNLARTVQLGRRQLQFRVSIINALRRQQLATPNLTPTSSLFGTISSGTTQIGFVTFQTKLTF